MSRLPAAPMVLAIVLPLAACGDAKVEIGAPPVADIKGPWQLVNRQVDCESAFTAFGSSAIWRLERGDKQKKLLDIQKFAVGPGVLAIDTNSLPYEPGRPLRLTFSLKDDKLRLVDLTTPEGQSFREPPADTPPASAEKLKTIFRLAGQKFAMDRCPAGA